MTVTFRVLGGSGSYISEKPTPEWVNTHELGVAWTESPEELA